MLFISTMLIGVFCFTFFMFDINFIVAFLPYLFISFGVKISAWHNIWRDNSLYNFCLKSSFLISIIFGLAGFYFLISNILLFYKII
jgi:hypothetical protein